VKRRIVEDSSSETFHLSRTTRRPFWASCEPFTPSPLARSQWILITNWVFPQPAKSLEAGDRKPGQSELEFSCACPSLDV